MATTRRYGRTCAACGDAIVAVGASRHCADCVPDDVLVECPLCGVTGLPERIAGAHDCGGP